MALGILMMKAAIRNYATFPALRAHNSFYIIYILVTLPTEGDYGFIEAAPSSLLLGKLPTT